MQAPPCPGGLQLIINALPTTAPPPCRKYNNLVNTEVLRLTTAVVRAPNSPSHMRPAPRRLRFQTKASYLPRTPRSRAYSIPQSAAAAGGRQCVFVPPHRRSRHQRHRSPSTASCASAPSGPPSQSTGGSRRTILMGATEHCVSTHPHPPRTRTGARAHIQASQPTLCAGAQSVQSRAPGKRAATPSARANCSTNRHHPPPPAATQRHTQARPRFADKRAQRQPRDTRA